MLLVDPLLIHRAYLCGQIAGAGCYFTTPKGLPVNPSVSNLESQLDTLDVGLVQRCLCTILDDERLQMRLSKADPV